jgi:DNA-binding HxlR family transcriptional regulator
MPNIRQILDKLSELQSRRALVLQQLTHIETMFLASDLEPESYVLREDSSRVPQEHIKQFLLDLETQLREIDDELKSWESLPVGTPTEEKKLTDETQARQVALKARKDRKERAAATKGDKTQ